MLAQCRALFAPCACGNMDVCAYTRYTLHVLIWTSPLARNDDDETGRLIFARARSFALFVTYIVAIMQGKQTKKPTSNGTNGWTDTLMILRRSLLTVIRQQTERWPRIQERFIYRKMHNFNCSDERRVNLLITDMNMVVATTNSRQKNTVSTSSAFSIPERRLQKFGCLKSDKKTAIYNLKRNAHCVISQTSSSRTFSHTQWCRCHRVYSLCFAPHAHNQSMSFSRACVAICKYLRDCKAKRGAHFTRTCQLTAHTPPHFRGGGCLRRPVDAKVLNQRSLRVQ